MSTEHGAEPAALAGIDVQREDWSLDRDSLVRALRALGLERIDVDLVVAMLAQLESRLTPFEMRIGSWSLSVPAATARSLFNSTVLTAALAIVHEPAISAAVLTFVVSAIFDIERVTVSPDRKHLRAEVHDPRTSIEEWYRRLPEHLRAELTEDQFRAIVRQFQDEEPDERSVEGTSRAVLLRLPGPDEGTASAHPAVFVTYSHDSPAHKGQVLRLAQLLRDGGIRIIIDQWATTHRQDWSTWAPRAIVRSDFTLMVASPDYKAAADDFDESDRNPGVRSEAAVIRDLLHGDRARWKRKLLPVLLPGHDKAEIPFFMQPNSADWYRIDELTAEGVRPLLAVLTAKTVQSDPAPHITASVEQVTQVEPQWRPLPKPLDVMWRVDVFGRPGYAEPSALELHLVPVDGGRMTISRLQQLPEALVAAGRAASFFTAAEAVNADWSEQAAWARSDRAVRGLAVFRDGQRTAWVPLVKANIGSIVNRDFAREEFARMLVILSKLAVPPSTALAPTAGLEPAELVREAPLHEANSGSIQLRTSSPPIRLTCEESLTSAEIIGSPEAIADELAARVLARLRGR